MLIGKPVFNAQTLDDLVNKVESGAYSVPTSVSKEIVAFLNGMLQYEGLNRLSAAELMLQPFLFKNVKDFSRIDTNKVRKKIDSKGLNINVKKNKTIWAIFNENDEEKLSGITPKNISAPPPPQMVQKPMPVEKPKPNNQQNIYNKRNTDNNIPRIKVDDIKNKNYNKSNTRNNNIGVKVISDQQNNINQQKHPNQFSNMNMNMNNMNMNLNNQMNMMINNLNMMMNNLNMNMNNNMNVNINNMNMIMMNQFSQNNQVRHYNQMFGKPTFALSPSTFDKNISQQNIISNQIKVGGNQNCNININNNMESNQKNNAISNQIKIEGGNQNYNININYNTGSNQKNNVISNQIKIGGDYQNYNININNNIGSNQKNNVMSNQSKIGGNENNKINIIDMLDDDDFDISTSDCKAQ